MRPGYNLIRSPQLIIHWALVPSTMTVSFRNPLSRIGKRGLKLTLVAILLVLVIAVPASMYWVIERNDMHARWDQQVREAVQFWSQTGYAALTINGSFVHWDNQTAGFAVNDLGYAGSWLYEIGVSDAAHNDQISRINYALSTLRTQDYVSTMNQTGRTFLAKQLWLVSHDVVNAYTNYLNYTSSGTGSGPPFWYNGPAPPDEKLLQDAVNTAYAFERK